LSNSSEVDEDEQILDQQDYYRLRVLFDDLDLEIDNPHIQEQLSGLMCLSIFDQFTTPSRDCFIEEILKKTPL